MDAGFLVVERYSSDSFGGSWYLTLDHDPRLRLMFDGRDRWLAIEWETDSFFGDQREWNPLWIGVGDSCGNSLPVVADGASLPR